MLEFQYRRRQCRETLQLADTPRNVKWAINARNQIVTEIATGKFDYASWFPDSPRAAFSGAAAVTTVGDLLERYLGICEGTLEWGTFVAYRYAIRNHLTPAFGSTPLREFRRSDVATWVAGLAVSQKRVNNLLIPLRGALRMAFDDELIERNPLEGYRPRKPVSRTADDIDPFEPSEIPLILEQLPGAGERNLYQFMFYSGLRPEEAIAIGWDDIDWVRGTVRVRRARTEGRWKGPKTRSGVRDVDLTPPARAALEAQKPLSWALPPVSLKALGEEVRIVFPNPRTNTFWSKSDQMRRNAWVPALRKAGLRYRPQKNTRHTFASMALTIGAHPGWVARQLGHSGLEMVFKNYGRWIQSADRTTTELVNEAMGELHDKRGSISM